MKGGGNIGSRAICETMLVWADRKLPLDRVLQCKTLKSLIRIPLLSLAHLLIEDIAELNFQNACKILS
jgi:hypothetical protein